jgi:hypothetical protein
MDTESLRCTILELRKMADVVPVITKTHHFIQ